MVLPDIIGGPSSIRETMRVDIFIFFLDCPKNRGKNRDLVNVPPYALVICTVHRMTTHLKTTKWLVILTELEAILLPLFLRSFLYQSALISRLNGLGNYFLVPLTSKVRR